MSGPTQAQTQLTNEETAAYEQAQTMTAQQYGAQSAIYAQMTPQFESIFAKGPSQEGFSPEETATLNAQAVEGTAENYSSAAKAVGEKLAGEGGGTNPLPTGASTELEGEIASSAAGEESKQESEIKSADYVAGRSNYKDAAVGLEGVATGLDPLGYEGAATSAGNSANTEANAIATEDDSWINAVIGAAGTIGGAYVGRKP